MIQAGSGPNNHPEQGDVLGARGMLASTAWVC